MISSNRRSHRSPVEVIAKQPLFAPQIALEQRRLLLEEFARLNSGSEEEAVIRLVISDRVVAG